MTQRASFIRNGKIVYLDPPVSLPDPAETFWRGLFQRWREQDELWRKVPVDGEFGSRSE